MFLKALQIRGFKSFANRTDLELMPGITVVVGPNGSGKSNLVDALAWVLGAQGARTLRGERMEDVIFSGSPARQALGRAEVTLTIDNSAGLIPVDLPEISLGRCLFRSGESRYTLNGENVRLLDLTELLSDSGVGRQLHTIVGQGQIDGVLLSRPEDRRVTIEEAAGVLKHRKRRERALRRLEIVEADLVRLFDVARELNRQIRPLERQVEGARRHEDLAAEARLLALWEAGERIRLRRADDCRAGEAAAAARTALGEARAQEEAAAAECAEREEEVSAVATRAEVARSLSDRAERSTARVAALGEIASERARAMRGRLHALAEAEAAPDAGVADREALAAELAAVVTGEQSLAERLSSQDDAERRHRAAESALEAAWRAAGLDGDDRRGALEAQHAALLAARDRASAETARAEERHGVLETRLAQLADGAEDLRSEIERLDAAAAPLAERLTRVESLRRRAEDETASLVESQRRWTSEAASHRARAESLEASLAEGVGAKAARGALTDRFGFLPRVRDVLMVERGAELAVAAALGHVLGAVLLPGGDAAAAVGVVKGVTDGSLSLGVAPDDRAPAGPAVDPAALGVLSLLELIRPLHGEYRWMVEALLRRHAAPCYLARSPQQALALSKAHPDLVFVTAEGDRFEGGLLAVRSPQRGAATDPALAAAEARRSAETAARRGKEVAAQLARREEELVRLRDEEAALGRELAESDALLTAQADVLMRSEASDADLRRERATLDAQLGELRRALVADGERLAELERLRDTEGETASQEERERLQHQRRTLESEGEALRRQALALEAERARAEERRRVLTERLAEFDRAESEGAGLRAEAAAQRVAVEAALPRLGDLADVARALGSEAARRRDHARGDLARLQGERDDLLGRLGVARTRRRDLQGGLQSLLEAEQSARLDVAEARLRLEASEEAPRRELGASVEDALGAVLPEGTEPSAVAGRLDAVERELRRIGPVNPLALEEFEVLKERRDLLTRELEDVNAAKRDILKVVHEVDRKISEILTSAYADVARHFADLFALLFPGGEGRVVLTKPEDVLETGIEIEARPSGKSLKRLSLLSGGERSLAALAFLFAVFRARPSPFYVLDEVEAALDDINLHRFCSLLREFRRDSQILVVTHQKRTMEVADILYGVSLGKDATSRVLAQRISDLDLSEDLV